MFLINIIHIIAYYIYDIRPITSFVELIWLQIFLKFVNFFYMILKLKLYPIILNIFCRVTNNCLDMYYPFFHNFNYFISNELANLFIKVLFSKFIYIFLFQIFAQSSHSNIQNNFNTKPRPILQKLSFCKILDSLSSFFYSFE